MTRRAFTLLEMMLAMVVGMLVLGTALSVMLSVTRTDSGLAQRAQEQHELASTRVVINKALTRLRPAPNNTVRDIMREGASDEEIEEYLDSVYPEPIEGAGFRFQLNETNGMPRLEVVSDRVPVGPTKEEDITDSDRNRRARMTSQEEQTGQRISFDDLDGFRGAIEVERSASGDSFLLWWVPLPPTDIPDGAWFDERSLPSPTLLSEHLKSISWTAFIDREKLSRVRATESRQFPAFVELELETTGGLYGSWMFELGWTPGPEIGISIDIPNPEGDDESELGGGA